MKRTKLYVGLLCLCITLLTSSQNALAQSFPRSSADKLLGSKAVEHISLTLKVTAENQKLEDATIKFISQNGKVFKAVTKSNGKLKVDLPVQEEYLIVIENEGFHSRALEFSTIIPEKFLEDVWPEQKIKVDLRKGDNKEDPAPNLRMVFDQRTLEYTMIGTGTSDFPIKKHINPIALQ